MEIKFLAARRIGELVPEEPRGGKSDRRSKIRTADIAPQRLTEFRKLAEIPIEQFKERIEVAKAKEERISYNHLLRGDWYQMTETPEWETPQWLFDLLDKEFHFDIDVCSSSQNSKCKNFYTKKENGLSQHWKGTCWMNPPYGRELPLWISKAKTESKNGVIVVCLVPARTDTEAPQDITGGAI